MYENNINGAVKQSEGKSLVVCAAAVTGLLYYRCQTENQSSFDVQTCNRSGRHGNDGDMATSRGSDMTS